MGEIFEWKCENGHGKVLGRQIKTDKGIWGYGEILWTGMKGLREKDTDERVDENG